MPDPSLREAFAEAKQHLAHGALEHFHAVAYDPTEWHREPCDYACPRSGIGDFGWPN